MTKPDFIIIGAMKSATSTLHIQLSLQPGIFMTTPKEPNYFSDDKQYALREQWYESLFLDAKKEDLCGESSTHYTKLPDYPLTIERMAKHLNSPKLIYVMRHPIDRLVSHYIHQWSQNVFKCGINEAIGKHNELTDYSCYARQLGPYFKQFGHENVLPVFTETMRQSPQRELERVAKFIGYPEPVVWHDDLAVQNVSRERIRTFLGYKWLIESNIMASLRRIIVPQSVRNRVKRRLTMQERPVIHPTNLTLLIKLFDSDLLKLKDWLGVEISCADFNEKIKDIEFQRNSRK